MKVLKMFKHIMTALLLAGLTCTLSACGQYRGDRTMHDKGYGYGGDGPMPTGFTTGGNG